MAEVNKLRNEILGLLEARSPLRESELLYRSGRSERVLIAALNGLERSGYIRRDEVQQWAITEAGLSAYRLKWVIGKLEADVLQEHFWSPGRLGYRESGFSNRMRRIHGAAKAAKLDAAINQAASRSLRWLQSRDVNIDFKDFMRLQGILGNVIRQNASVDKFALVLVFEPREALQKAVDRDSARSYSEEEFEEMVRRIKELWTTKAWVEKLKLLPR